MTDKERKHFLQTYGIDYVKEYEDERYEYGHYEALGVPEDQPKIIIQYRFLKT